MSSATLRNSLLTTVPISSTRSIIFSNGDNLQIIGTIQFPSEFDDGRQFIRDIWSDISPEIMAFGTVLIGIVAFTLIIKSLRSN